MDAAAWIALIGLVLGIGGAAATLLWRIAQQVAIATGNLTELAENQHRHGKRIGRLETSVFGVVKDQDDDDGC